MVAITKEQLVRVNRALNDYLHLKKTNKYLQMDLTISDSLCLYWERVAVKADTMLFMENQKYENLSRINKSLECSLKSSTKKMKKIGVGVGVGGTVFGIILGVLLKK